jgi:hypothetical protein
MTLSSIPVSVNGQTPKSFDIDDFWGWFIIEQVAKLQNKESLNKRIDLEFSINGEKLDIETAFIRIQTQWDQMRQDRDAYRVLLRQIIDADYLKKEAMSQAAEHFKDKE